MITLVLQWNPSIMDTTGTKHFVIYSEISFAQGVIVVHAPLKRGSTVVRVCTVAGPFLAVHIGVHLEVGGGGRG